MQVDKWLGNGKLKLLYKAAFSPHFLNSSSEHEVRERTGGRRKKRERGRKEERKRKKRKGKKGKRGKERGKEERKERKRKEKLNDSKVIFLYHLWYF